MYITTISEEENETFEHVLNECPCFIADRRDLFQDRIIENTLDWKPIQFSYIPSINEALSFDKRCILIRVKIRCARTGIFGQV